MKLAVITDYTLSSTTTFDMPDGKVWSDVEFWHVKWGTLFLTFKDGTAKEVETNEATLDSCDWKRPSLTEIRFTDEDGDADWSADEIDSVTN